MNIIIFGGAGFIGSSLTETLLEKGFNITIYDRNLDKKELPKGAYKKIEGNFFEEQDFSSSLEKQDIVIQLISGVSPVSSMVNMYNSYKGDLMQNLKLIESCKEKGIKKIIFVSSGGTVYGENNADAIIEDSTLFPQNHYGIVKSTIEQFLMMYNEQFGMENIVLRLANPYGIKQNLDKKIGAVATFCYNILNDITIEIYGDGKVIRDYISIEDVCEALICAINYNQLDEVRSIFNVGTGVGTNLLEIISMIEAQTGLKGKVDFKEARKVDVTRNVLSPTKAKQFLKFEANIILQKGIGQVLKNYGSN